MIEKEREVLGLVFLLPSPAGEAFDPPEVPPSGDVAGADDVVDGDVLRHLEVELELMREATGVDHVGAHLCSSWTGLDCRMNEIGCATTWE